MSNVPYRMWVSFTSPVLNFAKLYNAYKPILTLQINWILVELRPVVSLSCTKVISLEHVVSYTEYFVELHVRPVISLSCTKVIFLRTRCKLWNWFTHHKMPILRCVVNVIEIAPYKRYLCLQCGTAYTALTLWLLILWSVKSARRIVPPKN